MKVLCRLSQNELLRLQGEQSERVWLHDEHLVRTTMVEADPFAVIFETETLHLREEGEYTWRFQFRSQLLNAFTHPDHDLFIEEHPYHGASRRHDGRIVTKVVCRIGGGSLTQIVEAHGATPQYLAPELATVSRYWGGGITLKELRVSQIDSKHWQLIIWVWRGHARDIINHPRLGAYRPIVLAAKEFEYRRQVEEMKGVYSTNVAGPAH